MKRFAKALVLAGASAVLLAGAANAAIVVSSTFGAPDPGPRPGETQIIDLEAPQAGVTESGDYRITSGTTGTAAMPALDTTMYLSVPDDLSAGATATLTFATFLGNKNVSGFSFYWGSIDLYNTLELLHRDGTSYATILGGAFPPANGDQFGASTNRRIAFDLTGGDQDLGGLRFTSTSYAFETDDFAFNTVPEPTTWAMMLMGFFGMGALVRRRRHAAIA